MNNDRKVIDCRNAEGSTCSVTIAGTEDEVMHLAIRHAVEEHGYEDTPKLHDNIKAMMQEA